MKIGQILMKNEKNNIFWNFSEKYEQMSKKVKNDENRSNIDKKRSQLMENEKDNIFWIFFRKVEGNVEKSEK